MDKMRAAWTAALASLALCLGSCGGGGGSASAGGNGLPPPLTTALPVVGFDGAIHTSALSADGRTLYVGGEFTRIGAPSGSVVPVDASTGAIAPHTVVNGAVWSRIKDASGGSFIAGSFTTIGGVPWRRLAHLLSDGSLDTRFVLGIDADISSVALNGSTLMISGYARTGPNAGNFFVSAVDATTGAPLSWTAIVYGPVTAMALSGSVLYFGGDFIRVDGQRRSHLAAVDANTGVLLPWNPEPNNGNTYPLIRTLVAAGDTIYVGGSFISVGGASRRAVAALDASTGVATSWDPALDQPNGMTEIFSIALDGSAVYLGGGFSAAGGRPRAAIAAVDARTAEALPWDAGLESQPFTAPLVTALAVSPDSVYVSGQFQLSGGAAATRTTALNKNTAAARPWVDAGPTVSVSQMSVEGSRVFINGNFAILTGAVRNHIAAIDTATGQLTDWNPDSPNTDGNVMTGVVRSLLVAGSKVYAAGSFTRIGGRDQAGLAALDPSTGTALPWNPQVIGGITTLSASSSTLFVGGASLGAVNGQSRNGLAAFDLATGQLNSWSPDASGAASIRRLVPTGQSVLVGGAFSSMAGQTRRGLAAFDSLSGDLLSWNPDADSSLDAYNVADMTLLDGTLYVVGNFLRVGGQNRVGLAALDPTSGAVSPWAPIGVVRPRAVAATGDRVYVALDQGGGNPPAQGVLTLSVSQAAVVPTQYVLEGFVESISASPTKLFFAGNFTDANSALAPNLAAFLR